MKRLKHYWTRSVHYMKCMQTRVVLGLLAGYPGVSSAQDIQGVINNTVTYLRGGTARAAGILGIIIAGYLCLARQTFPKEYFMMLLVGMGLIFGSASLYNTLIGM